MTVLSLSNKHASNWQNFLLVRKCLTLSEAQTWSLAGRLKRQRQVVLQKAVDYQYPGFIETTGDPVKQTDDNVTIPVLSKYKFCLKFMKLSRLTDSPLPPPPAVPPVNHVTFPKKISSSLTPPSGDKQ